LLTDGIFQSQREIDEHKAQARFAAPGDIRYRIPDGNTNDDINDRDYAFADRVAEFTSGVQFQYEL
jgi:hypothetical protein